MQNPLPQVPAAGPGAAPPGGPGLANPRPARAAIAFVPDIDEVAAALARSVESAVRPLCNWGVPKAARLVNAAAKRPVFGPRAIDRGTQRAAVAAGGCVLVAGAGAAIWACMGALENASAAREEKQGWLDEVAALPARTAVQTDQQASRLNRLAGRYATESAWQAFAAASSAGGAALMAATLLLSASLLGALSPVIVSLSTAAMWGAVALMGTYGIVQAVLAGRNHHFFGQIESALRAGSVATLAAAPRAELLQDLTAAMKWQRGISVGGVLLSAGLVLQMVALWTGVTAIFVGSLILEYSRQRESNLLPRPLPSACREGAAHDQTTAQLPAAAARAVLDQLGQSMSARRTLMAQQPWLPWLPACFRRTNAGGAASAQAIKDANDQVSSQLQDAIVKTDLLAPWAAAA